MVRTSFGPVAPLRNPKYIPFKFITRSLHMDDVRDSYNAERLVPYPVNNSVMINRKNVLWYTPDFIPGHNFYGNVSFVISWELLLQRYNMKLYLVDQAAYSSKTFTRLLLSNNSVLRDEVDFYSESSPIIKRSDGYYYAKRCSNNSGGCVDFHEVQIAIEVKGIFAEEMTRWIYQQSFKIPNDHDNVNLTCYNSNMRNDGRSRRYESYRCFKYNTSKNRTCLYPLSENQVIEQIRRYCSDIVLHTFNDLNSSTPFVTNGRVSQFVRPALTTSFNSSVTLSSIINPTSGFSRVRVPEFTRPASTTPFNSSVTVSSVINPTSGFSMRVPEFTRPTPTTPLRLSATPSPIQLQATKSVTSTTQSRSASIRDFLPINQPTSTVVQKRVSIGIDFGSSKCSVSVFRNKSVEHIDTIPSYVGFTNREILVGKDARDQYSFNSQNTVHGIKRFIGRTLEEAFLPDCFRPFKMTYRTDLKSYQVEVRYKNQTLSLYPEEIVALILKKAKKLAEEYLGFDVDSAVISVPAQYSTTQCQAIKDAATIAGLNSSQLINETTAIAMAYQYDRAMSSNEETVLVVNFGGGFMEMSVVALKRNAITVKASSSLRFGGINIDDSIMEHLLRQIEQMFSTSFGGDHKVKPKLLTEIEQLKKTLFYLPSAVVPLDQIINKSNAKVSVTKEQMNDLTYSKIESNMKSLVNNVLSKCSLSRNDIRRVLISGGSSFISAFEKIVFDIFDHVPLKCVGNESVSKGAAIKAVSLINGLQELSLHDSASSSLKMNIMKANQIKFDYDANLEEERNKLLSDLEYYCFSQISTYTHNNQSDLSTAQSIIKLCTDTIDWIDSDQILSAEDLKARKERIETICKRISVQFTGSRSPGTSEGGLRSPTRQGACGGGARPKTNARSTRFSLNADRINQINRHMN